jgi:8-oxo-dGTP pyrophosphatase MutT (NUDIX family)
MIWTPHATVAAIVEKQGRFLVVEEMADGARVINQPAGHVEEGESLLDAVRRETLEETRWRVEPEYLIGIYIYTGPNNVTYYRFCYACRPLNLVEHSQLDEGIIAAHWMKLDELEHSAIPLRSPLVTQCIRDYVAGKRYPISLVYEHEVESAVTA